MVYIAARVGDRRRAEDEIAQALRMSPGETKVIRNVVLTYEGGPAGLLRETMNYHTATAGATVRQSWWTAEHHFKIPMEMT